MKEFNHKETEIIKTIEHCINDSEWGGESSKENREIAEDAVREARKYYLSLIGLNTAEAEYVRLLLTKAPCNADFFEAGLIAVEVILNFLEERISANRENAKAGSITNTASESEHLEILRSELEGRETGDWQDLPRVRGYKAKTISERNVSGMPPEGDAA